MEIELPAVVYILCALTSSLCAIALLGRYRASQVRLLFWSGLGFAGLAVNNIFLFIDLIIVPDINLSIVRTLPALLGLGVMIWGFVGESA
jgi:hypothetical protein